MKSSSGVASDELENWERLSASSDVLVDIFRSYVVCDYWYFVMCQCLLF